MFTKYFGTADFVVLKTAKEILKTINIVIPFLTVLKPLNFALAKTRDGKG
jgi:hypothetical protein